MTTPRTAAETVTATAGLIGAIGSAFMLHPETMARATELGYPNGFAFYFAGRGGVLGDVDADVVVASFGFFAPAMTRMMWEQGVAVHGARTAGHQYAEACAAWGRHRLAGIDGIDRLVHLAERVVAAADPAGLPLFAGWRAEPRVDDAPGRAMQLMHVLREWRGSAHVVAALASGLTPLEAILTKDGPDRAKMFGWAEPFPDVSALVDRRNAAEDLTDRLCAPAYESALDAGERGEFVALVEKVGSVLLG